MAPALKFLDMASKNTTFQKIVIDCINLNPNFGQLNDSLYKSFEAIASFYTMTPQIRDVIREYNIEEVNYVILSDGNGKISYLGNLQDPDFYNECMKTIDKGTKTSKSEYKVCRSIFQKVSRRYPFSISELR